jgi:hypothetical protein
MPITKRLIAGLFMSVSILVYACSMGNTEKSNGNNTPDSLAQKEEPKANNLIARGEYLLTIGGCNDCHTPKIFNEHGMQFDSSRLYSGHPAGSPLPPVDKNALQPGQWMQMSPLVTAFVGPWGISYAANLTPDSASGIGAWSEDVFIKTMRTGKHLGQKEGRPILPPMPWYNVAKLKDNDLQAVYAYLRSLPPVSNKVPAPVPPTEVLK